MGALSPPGAAGAGTRTLLVVGGGVEAVPGVERVRRLGVRVAVSDGSPSAPALALADERLLASTYDADATAAAAAELHVRAPLAGVLSIACDVPRTVAAVAARLGLPGPSARTAELAADKLAMKEALAAAGVPVPWYAPCESPAELARTARARGLPLVVKPADSRGARGVIRLTGDVDPDWAHAAARAASPTGRVLVEEYVEGSQLSSESVLQDGRAVTLGLSDRNYARLEVLAPFFVEDGGTQPSEHLDDVLPAANQLVERAAAAIGLATGTLKGDLVLHPARGLVAIEVAPRLSGGWFATDQIPYSTGVDLVQAAARLAMGERIPAGELRPRGFRPVAVRYAFPPPGRLVAVEGVDALRAEPWCLRAAVLARPGDEIRPARDHTARPACVLATGATRAEAVARAEEGVRRLSFRVAPA